MSTVESSDDEFAAYQTTTPAKPTANKHSAITTQPVAGPSQLTKGKRSKEVSKAAHVPSKKVPDRGTARKTTSHPISKKPNGTSMNSQANSGKKKTKEPPVVMEVSSDDSEAVATEPLPSTVPTAQSKRTAVNGKVSSTTAAAATKGKARANAHVVENDDEDGVEEAEPMVVDEPVVEDEPPQKRKRTATRPATKTAHAVDQTGSSEVEEGLRREVERLKAQIGEVESQRDKLSKQLEELFQIRRTEPEKALEEQEKQFEARLKVQETLLEEQAKLIVASTSGQPYMLHFLSREAADEEKKEVEKEVARWKEVVKQRDVKLAQKDEQITELVNQNSQLTKELEAEVERGKSLASRNAPSSGTRNNTKGIPTIKDPKHTAVLRLYEDLTNILVLGVEFEHNPHNHPEDDSVFDCVLTDPNQADPMSVHFSLRRYHEPDLEIDANVSDDNPLMLKAEYRPKDLEKESEEFIQRLDFFKDPFLFGYDQIFVFFKTFVEKICPPGTSDETEDQAAEAEVDE
ncbi:hypothetical protein NLI96_g9309 [Meripilus lineatus]|uniref:Monopolin complex subunit Csm1/Pcs1 C-terminal domain-containing protein n=1 Tax=Meripilus lineatus TaxID=2056292 RepID=A0AAD5YFC2_9APHY|nr:hypothetical protein NLI96_g9309 [Physisporinus lineatus]